MTKLYVGNLPFSATEDSVRALFAAHGNVDKVALVNDRDTGQPRGFGFVEMANADAQKAMQSLNGQDFGGRPLKVNEAQDKPRGGGGGGVVAADTVVVKTPAVPVRVGPVHPARRGASL